MRLRSINDIFRVLFPPTGRASAWWTGSNSASVCLHTHSPQQYTGGQPESVCCSQSVRCVIFRVVSTPWPNLQISSFAPQHIRQDYPQALRRLSALLVRLSCHSSSGWQRHCRSDPGSFPKLFSSITANQTKCHSGRKCTLHSAQNITGGRWEWWEITAIWWLIGVRKLCYWFPPSR